MSETRSDVFGGTGTERAPGREVPVLAVVMNADDLSFAPSRHLLAGIDVVCFARGSRAAVRDRADGLERLVLTLPDPLMSTEHGRLLRVQSRWMLDDPSSKNGAVIAGQPSRAGMVQLGDLFELGHTLFLLDASIEDTDRPADLIADAAAPLASLHPNLEAIEDALALVAPSDVPILLVGETGTGKEVYARAIHNASGRAGPLVAVNCGALPASLLEAELFGHRRGAFSGATADRPGFIRAAHRGTLFLDEINELSMPGQIALLRVLQEREVTPVGDSQPVTVDIRVCAASQRPLALEVDAGRFRSDLYARLLGYEVRLPPLAQRPFDLGALIARLASRLAEGRRVSFTPPAARALLSYEWPLNVRELERCLATALVLARGRAVDVGDLPEAVRAATGRIRRKLAESEPSREEPALRTRLAAKLVEHRGNVSAIARDLGKHREQVNRWLRRFGFDPEAFRR